MSLTSFCNSGKIHTWTLIVQTTFVQAEYSCDFYHGTKAVDESQAGEMDKGPNCVGWTTGSEQLDGAALLGTSTVVSQYERW